VVIFNSVFGFIAFAAADIAAVEWIRRIISYIDSNDESLNTLTSNVFNIYCYRKGFWFFYW